MRIINQAEVVKLLPMSECIELMAETLSALARHEAILPLRTIMWLPEKFGALGMMPAYLPGRQVMGLKIVGVFPGNHGTEFDSHIGGVMIFETQHGQPLALVDASEITAIRTAAVSGVATRLLAREDAHDLTILGTGTQARTHLEAMMLVRRVKRVRVWSRNLANAESFAEREGKRVGVAIEVSGSIEKGVRGADIVCTTTAAKEPIVRGEWLSEGCHINAVGSSVSFARELDSAAVVRSRLYVDRRESTLNEAGDFLFPKQEGAIGDDHIRGEIGELLIGGAIGRTSPMEITLFKSLGLAVEDVAAAHYIYQKALAAKSGVEVELGGRRNAGH